MKTAALILVTAVVLMVALGCALVTTPIPPAGTPVPVLPTNTSEPAAIESPNELPAEAPVNLEAPYDESAAPQREIENALARSQKDGKLVLLDFGANWCPDCLVLTKLFEDPAVKPFLEENYRMVRIDVGNWDKNLDISEKYGNPIENGIPAVVILAPNGEIIASTKDGALANARTATAQEILKYLQTWFAQKP